jgi:cytoskeleton protein RodZ
MNETNSGAATESASSPEPAGLSFGPRLASAREALSLSVNDIAARLRLSPKQVIAIEGENLAVLPGPAFLRGFVRNYAKEVRLDPAPLIGALNRILEPGISVDAPAQARSPLVHPAERERFSRAFVIVGAVGALLVFAVAGWISNSRSRQAASSVGPGDISPVAATLTVAPAWTVSGAAANAAAAPESLALTSSRTASNAEAFSQSQPAKGVEVPAPIGASAIEPTALRLSFREISWVQLTQQDGTVLLSQNNPAGTEQIVRGKPPYQLVIGNASAVSLEYGGKTVDLKPLTSAGNVARLTVQ